MADDPFAEPDDTDKTVIRPNPGGRRTQATKPAATPDKTSETPAQGDAFGIPAAAAKPASSTTASGASISLSMTGMNRLNACASTLFSLISRIRNRAQHLDPDKLRQSVVAEVRNFESRALQAQIEPQTVKIARYAICATLDDVVLNTPWGGQSSWAQQSMVGTFHRETVGGDRFYDLLARLEKEPGNNIDLLEFLYMCLSLGFEGRLRVETGGSDKHMQIRNGLARVVRAQRGVVERELSPNWKGLDRPYRVLSAWRVLWIAIASSAAILATVFLALSYFLTTSTERVIGKLSVLGSGAVTELLRRAPPPPPVETEPEKLEKVRSFLAPEISEGIVSVFEKGNTLIIRITGAGMFKSASDSLQPAFASPLQRVAVALNDEAGPVIIVGHSDNVPIRSARFPSNMHLSLARAESVMNTIAFDLQDPSRLSAEGRADKDPIADNSPKSGRAANRRIEILLVQGEEQ